MQAFMTAKVRPFLVISSVLAAWILLAAQPAQAHTTNLPAPSCTSNLPTATDFFTDTPGTAATAGIALPSTFTGTPTPKPGEDIATRGSSKYYYAEITIPQLAAGELRVFDTRNTDGNTPAAVSDAVLCQGASERARYRTTYLNHDRTSNFTTITGYQTTVAGYQATASTASADSTTTEAQAKSALRTAASHLDIAAGYLRTAAGYLRTAANSANTAVAAQNATDAALAADRAAVTATNAATTARTAANTPATDPANPTDPANGADERAALGIAASALGTAGDGATASAAGALGAAATELNSTAGKGHVTFQIRAEVKPGDETYILVAAAADADGAAAPSLAVEFEGAIAADTEQRTRVLNNDAVDSISLTVTTPGLLTLETTGSVDTIGILANAGSDTALTATADDVEVAYAESGGSGDNFKFAVPVAGVTHTLMVEEGQTSGGEYTLSMDFKVAMVTSSGLTTVPVTPTTNPWTTTAVPDDDEPPLQIKKIAADGSTADEDYILFTPNASGLLTVNANDDTDGSTKNSDTSGTLYGAMETGPMMEMRAGEIATDSDSGPGNHFKFAVPVVASRNYLMKVEGTDGYYTLMFDFDQTTADIAPTSSFTPTNLDPACAAGDPNNRGEICRSTGEPETERYLLNIAESGALYVHTTGGIDVLGTLYGADGRQVAMDEDSGDGNNFRIATNVGPGLYLLEVRGKTRAVQGVYGLVSNFVTGAEVDTPTTPTDPTDPTDPTPPATDAEGELEDPPNNGSRSGIGLIRAGCVRLRTSGSVFAVQAKAPHKSSTPSSPVWLGARTRGGRSVSA